MKSCLPSRDLTYPSCGGKRTSSTKKSAGWEEDMSVVRRAVNIGVLILGPIFV